MISMYQTTDENLNKIRADLRSKMQTRELEMAGLVERKIPVGEKPVRYTTVQGEAGFIELLARAREHKL